MLKLRIASIAAGLTFVGVCLSSAARADEPVGPPEDHEVCSLNRRFCVETLAKPEMTTIYEHCADGSRVPLWKLDGWHRYIWVSNDGQRVVTNPSGGLLPQRDAAAPSPDMSPEPELLNHVAVRIHAPSGLVRALFVSDVLAKPEELVRTASHWSWGNIRLADNDVLVARARCDWDSARKLYICSRLSYHSLRDGRTLTSAAVQGPAATAPTRCGRTRRDAGLRSAGCANRCSVSHVERTAGAEALLVLGLFVLRRIKLTCARRRFRRH